MKTIQLVLAAGLLAMPAFCGSINFDDISSSPGFGYFFSSTRYAAQGVTFNIVNSVSDTAAVGDTFTATLTSHEAGTAGAPLIFNNSAAVSAPNFAVPLKVVCPNGSCTTQFNSEEMLMTFSVPVNFAELFTDIAPDEAADVVRLLALKSLGNNQYKIMAIDSGFDNQTSVPANRLSVYVPGGFDALLFQTTTEQEGFDNLNFANVPEPGSMALMGSGLALVGLWARRRKLNA
jgi:hypothetical protein